MLTDLCMDYQRSKLIVADAILSIAINNIMKTFSSLDSSFEILKKQLVALLHLWFRTEIKSDESTLSPV